MTIPMPEVVVAVRPARVIGAVHLRSPGHDHETPTLGPDPAQFGRAASQSVARKRSRLPGQRRMRRSAVTS